MDSLFKALLTASTVLLVMVAARRGGRRLAGIVAALPTITAPTLAWLADAQGVGFAVSAAIGSVAACGMLAVFALAYARAARYGRGAIALLCALAGALAMALPAEAASADLGCAIALALMSCALAFAAMPGARADVDVVSVKRSWRSTVLIATAVGGLTAFTASFGPLLGGFATGLLSSLPLVTGSVAMAEHASHGHRAAAHFLRSYVAGLFGKVAFGAAFVLLAPRLGVVSAVALACACACLVSTLRLRQQAAPIAPLPLVTRRQPE